MSTMLAVESRAGYMGTQCLILSTLLYVEIFTTTTTTKKTVVSKVKN